MIFVSGVLVVPNLSYVNLLYVDQQQLRNVALDALKTMLLDPGDPVNWGSQEGFDPNSSDHLQRFGLASSAGDSFYVLDPDKVQRLDMNKQSPFWNCVEYDKMRDLLGLEGYGFSLRIFPPFNVTVSDKHFNFTNPPYSIDFKVEVFRHDGIPLANAAVNPTIIYSAKDGGNLSINAIHGETVFTDLLGTCEINETLQLNGDIMDLLVVLRVTVANIAIVIDIYHSFEDLAEFIKINYGTGDNVTLSISKEDYPFDQPNEADWIINIAGYYGPEDIEDLYSGGKKTSDMLTWGEGYKTWNRDIPGVISSDPTLVIFVLSCVPKGEGRTSILIVSSGPNYIGPEGFQFGGEQQGATLNLKRTVIISGMPYLVEMTLWKEAP